MTAQPKAQVPRFIGLGNLVIGTALRLGVPVGPNRLVTIRGRTTGRPRTMPLAIVEHAGERYLQSPFGNTQWVRNLRAAGQATLRRGRRVERVHTVELAPPDAAPILRAVRAQMEATAGARALANQYPIPVDAPDADWEREAARHPTFRIMA